MATTIFDQIINGEIPCEKVFEDDEVLAFRDIKPQAPIHVLVIPKKPVVGLRAIDKESSERVGNLFKQAAQVAKLLDIEQDGYRLVVNEGTHGQQSVEHLHIHIIGGKQLTWPPG